MRPKSLLLLGLALGCGLVASIGISQVMDRNSRPQASLETTPIYVAKHNINTGDPIDATMVTLQEWPKGKVPKGAIASLEELEGRRASTTIIEGESILDGKLLAPGESADPIQLLQKGMRLKTISVDATKSAAGLLGPGDRVDVHLFVRANQQLGIPMAQSKVILQNVRVFAVGSDVQRSSDGTGERAIAKTISLMLTPEQASKLTLAENLGELSLVPRNPDDESSGDWTVYRPEDLWQEGEPGSRAFEQGRNRVAAETTEDGDLVSVVQSATAPKPPITMEIVERDVVRIVSFDPDTLKPIREAGGSASMAGPMVDHSSQPGGPASDGEVPTPAGDPDKILDDFPIEF
jgi:pilus assembly protein CpaB